MKLVTRRDKNMMVDALSRMFSGKLNQLVVVIIPQKFKLKIRVWW